MTCSCGNKLINSPVRVDLALDNEGGMNIFYWSTNSDRQTENLYSNCQKTVTLKGNTNASGDVPVYVSTNYNNNFTVSCGSCSADYSGEMGNLGFYGIGLFFGGIFIFFLKRIMS